MAEMGDFPYHASKSPKKADQIQAFGKRNSVLFHPNIRLSSYILLFIVTYAVSCALFWWKSWEVGHHGTHEFWYFFLTLDFHWTKADSLFKTELKSYETWTGHYTRGSEIVPTKMKMKLFPKISGYGVDSIRDHSLTRHTVLSTTLYENH